jgi:hypothetical protein
LAAIFSIKNNKQSTFDFDDQNKDGRRKALMRRPLTNQFGMRR